MLSPQQSDTQDTRHALTKSHVTHTHTMYGSYFYYMHGFRFLQSTYYYGDKCNPVGLQHAGQETGRCRLNRVKRSARRIF